MDLDLRAIPGCGKRVTVFRGFEIVAHALALDHASYCEECRKALKADVIEEYNLQFDIPE